MSRSPRRRLVVLQVLVASLLLTLLGRLWYLQVLTGADYRQVAAANRTRTILTPAARGAILDAAGRPLATNRTALVVAVDRVALLRQPDDGAAVLSRLSRVLKIRVGELRQRITPCGPKASGRCWNGSPYQPVPVTQLDPSAAATRTALTILERREDFPGVSAQVRAVRSYPGGSSAAHLLGYVGPISQDELAALPAGQRASRRSDLVGRSGLEQQYDDALRGRPGLRTVSVDSAGAVTGTVREVAPRSGQTLVTSISVGVQRALERALAGAVARARTVGRAGGGGPADTAAGVVLDARTGAVVALASYPTFDPNAFVPAISTSQYRALTAADNGSPLFDKAIQGQYPPGSSFKPISTTGLVAEGTASFSGSYDCPGAVTIAGQTFRNFESIAMGTLSLRRTLVVSCDTVYYPLAYADYLRDQARIAAGKKPLEAVQRTARRYGLGAPTGVDLPGEAGGLIEDRAQRRRYWETFLRPNACKGARDPRFSPQRRAADLDYCKYGYVYRPGDQVMFDIGQGTVLVTPLQMAAAYAALVNGGTVYSPRVGRALLGPDGSVRRRLRAPVRGRLGVDPRILADVTDAMYGVTSEPGGTAYGAFAGFPQAVVQVGGKTGTAENGPGKPPTAWFGSFAGPPGNPRYVTVVTVHYGGQGGVVAAPAVREVWDAVFGLEGQPAALVGVPSRAGTGGRSR